MPDYRNLRWKMVQFEDVGIRMNKDNCNWLMENADISIRHRVARDFLKDTQQAKMIHKELESSPIVTKWLTLLKPKSINECKEHGSPDNFMENALPKLVELGINGDCNRLTDAMSLYLDQLDKHRELNNYFGRTETSGVDFRTGKQFNAILIANYSSMANIQDKRVSEYILGSLEELYRFCSKNHYIEYYSEEERKNLRRVPKVWQANPNFIRCEFTKEFGFSYPLNYDVVGLYRLYDQRNSKIDHKVDTVISYILTDEYHERTADGYGILAEENGGYHAMGWDAKCPGWYDAEEYLQKYNSSRLLYYAMCLANYKVAVGTKWFRTIREVLEQYRTDEGTYIFPSKWLQEKSGYTIGGAHMSFGENRRKKNWCEVESTFYMLLLNRLES